jgi:oligoendopeptidase F
MHQTAVKARAARAIAPLLTPFLALFLAASLVVLLLVPAAARAADEPRANWDLTDLYQTDADWKAAFEALRKSVDELPKYRGTLGKSAHGMLAALSAISQAQRQLGRVGVYASLSSDQDIRVQSNLERFQQAQSLQTKLGEATAWVTPELLNVGAKKIAAFRKQDAGLDKHFGFYLDNALRSAPHVLGAEAESVIASTGSVLAQPDTLHTILANAELPFPTVTFSDGKSLKLGQAMYERMRQSPNRADRKLAFDEYWGAWKKFEGTAGSMLATQVMGDHFTAQVRKFPSALESAQFPDNMPPTVYRQLVAQTHAALPTLYRYLKLRKHMLGITDELHYYDNYPKMFPVPEGTRFDLDSDERYTLEALKPLGEDYLGFMRKGFAGRWMSLYPQEGKKLGAYMNPGAFDVHPYLLLNDDGDYKSLSTFAHEWGHAVHSLLANRAQPFEKSNYSTFIAESASIGNEMLLSDYMVEHAATKPEKLFYLGEALETIRTSYFRQVMFAEFELAVHEELEHGKPLSGQRMSEIYCGLLRQYYGEAEGVMKIDPTYCSEWEVVPHFYYNFYVYQYATSIAGAALMTDAVLHEGAPARQRFITMLSAGGSDYPYELYKRAGVDMATPAPYQALEKRMNHILDEIDSLLEAK